MDARIWRVALRPTADKNFFVGGHLRELLCPTTFPKVPQNPRRIRVSGRGSLSLAETTALSLSSHRVGLSSSWAENPVRSLPAWGPCHSPHPALVLLRWCDGHWPRRRDELTSTPARLCRADPRIHPRIRPGPPLHVVHHAGRVTSFALPSGEPSEAARVRSGAKWAWRSRPWT